MARARIARAARLLLLALPLTGCAAADVPVLFVGSPEPEAAAPANAAQTNAPAATAVQPVATAPRQNLPFPTFSSPAAASGRPVLDDAQQKSMEAELQGLAKQRETKMRQEIEQAQ